MKRFFMLMLSLVIMLSSVSISQYAFAQEEIPEYKVGDSFEYRVYSDDEKYVTYNDEGEIVDTERDRFYGVFVPQKTDYYEFVCGYQRTGERGYMSFCIWEDGGKKIEDVTPQSPYYDSGTMKMTMRLESGKTYLIGFAVEPFYSDYSGTVSINNHVHTFKTTTWPATQEHPTKWNNGRIDKECTACDYWPETTVIYAPKKISLDKSSYVYDGKKHNPKVTVYDKNGKTISSSNYKLKGELSKKNVGVYLCWADFNNSKYKGTMLYGYTINPKGTSIKSFSPKKNSITVKWNKQATQTTGYIIHYSTDSKFKKNDKEAVVKNNKSTSKSIGKLKRKTKYYFKIKTYKTVNGIKIYSSWSKVKSIKTK